MISVISPQDSASVHACAYLDQARTLEPSFYFLKSAVIFPIIFKCYHAKRRFSNSYKIQGDIKLANKIRT